jgi:hypothetical protein
MNKLRRGITTYMHEAVLFIYFFFIVFGAKIGFLDVSFFAGLVGIVFALRKYPRLCFNKKILFLAFLIIMIMGIALLSILINQVTEVTWVLRYIRVLVNFISIYLVISTLNIRPQRLLKIIINILLIHAVVVIIGAINIDFQAFISNFTGYSKSTRVGRSTGLTIGFDIAGILVSIGFIGTVILRIISNKSKVLQLLIFAIAGMLTTRFTMILILAMLLVGIFIFKKYKCRIELFLCTTLFTLSALISVSIFTISVNLGGVYNKIVVGNDFIGGLVFKLVDSYHKTNFSQVTQSHYDFESLNNWFIGDGYLYTADPGYTITLYSMGILGVLLSLLFYLYILRICFKSSTNNYGKNMRILVTAWVLVVIVFNAKNSYMFTRNISEVGFILFFIFMSFNEWNNKLSLKSGNLNSKE